jgi:hypothetical protein
VGTVIVAEEKQKPPFDADTLAKLLEAAFVLQEHGDELRGLKTQLGLPTNELAHDPQPQAIPNGLYASARGSNRSSAGSPPDDYSTTLGQIAEVQHQIEARKLGLADAMALVVNTLTVLCGAAGAAIAISLGEQIIYPAVAGSGCLPAGSSVPAHKALGSSCIHTGQVLRCPDVNAELLIDGKECIRRGIHSLIAVPVFRDAGVAGAVELYFADRSGFGETDIQSCQLMAGIVAEALASEDNPAGTRMAIPAAPIDQQSTFRADPTSLAHCYKCGHELVGEEQFCGQCGAARSEGADAVTLQSKVASLWHMQESGLASAGQDQSTSAKSTAGAQMAGMDSSSLAAEVPINLHALLESLANISEQVDGSKHPWEKPQAPSAEESAEDPASIEATPAADWSSALSAREFLEQVADGNRQGRLAKFWNEHRGDIYLGIAILLVISVIRWGLWTSNSGTPRPSQAAGSAPSRKVSAPELSLYDRMLIRVGLAEAPAPPEDKGNPAAAVWVDLNTGLYYCPGTDLYGNTPKGKYTAQRDAQLDQFEPAYRKVCN